MTELFLAAFVTFFVVIDPPGVLPIFVGLTEGSTARHRRLMAIKSIAIAALVLLGFAYGGEWLLRQLHISLDAFRIAGGALLFLIAIDMLFEKRMERREARAEAALKHEQEMHPPPAEPDISVFPMAIPMIAGPGAIASVLLHMNEAESGTAQLMVLAAVGLNLLICLVLFLAAGPVSRLIGATFTATLTRILGLVLAALSVQFILDGARGAFGLTP
jgi:multiple antibiotic resistance protein